MDANTVLTETTIVPFIRPANRMVIDRLTGQGIATATLREIERWLTAHFAAMSDRETHIASEGEGKARIKYAGKTGMNLEATRYGQMAMVLDPSGKLADANTAVPNRRKAKIDVLDHINGGTT